MRILSPFLRALFLFMVSATFINGLPARASDSGSLSVSAPAGFEDLMAERDVVLDVYFGGAKVGEVRARLRPGFVTFTDPRYLAQLIPDTSAPEQLASALAGPIPANVGLVCAINREPGCGLLQPEQAGIILDEERFKVEIFVNPRLLKQPDPAAALYLDKPAGGPSLVSHFGASLSGSSRGGTSWHVQNRSIASVGGMRLRSDSSVMEGAGIRFDNLTLETDRRDWRFLGGLFWAPGSDLVGRRRILGVGAATQLDTRQNKLALLGTPLEIFLQHPARVELLIDGRIAASRIYPAGNRLIDTASLPDGSYALVLRIHEDGRPARDEQRFFSKGASMAPIGRPLMKAFVGLLPPSSDDLAFNRASLFYEMSAAYRISPSVGLDAAILGTGDKVILDAGMVHHRPSVQFRLGALVSTSGDHGFALRATTTTGGPAALSFDLRKITSVDGEALLPVSVGRATFSEDSERGLAGRGSYLQALSIASYRFEQATLRVTGLYRRNGGEQATYSVGASLEVPVVRSSRWHLIALADAHRTERDFSSFLGLRFLATRGDISLSGSGGMTHQSRRKSGSGELVGEAQAAWHRQFDDLSLLATDVAVGRTIDGAYSRAGAYLRSRAFNGRADILHQFAGRDKTQFAATLDTGIVVTGGGAGLAGRDVNDSGILVSVSGGDADQDFDVLIDEVVRGTIRSGGRLTLFLEPYHAYDIRLRPRKSHLSSYDAGSQRITLYPGSVAKVHWNITPLFIMFGRALGADGQPVAHAEIAGVHGVGRTDNEGYFQIETKRDDRLRLRRASGAECSIIVGAALPVDNYHSAGDQRCQ